MRKKRNKNKVFLIKMLIFLLCIIIIFFLIKGTFSRFSSDANAVGSLSTAMYIVDEGYDSMNLKLDTMIPRSESYEYVFSVSNYNGTDRAEVNLEYELSVITTTNLPLTYELYLNNNSTNIITSDVISKDEHGTYFRTLLTEKKQFGFTEDESNLYKLVIYFPETYKDIEYQDVIEGIEVQVNSSQIID